MSYREDKDVEPML